MKEQQPRPLEQLNARRQVLESKISRGKTVFETIHKPGFTTPPILEIQKEESLRS